MDFKLESALFEVIQKVSMHFGPKAVLRGGMAMRLQGISRSTIDADFTFQPSRHKKEDFGNELVELISSMSDTPVKVNDHSHVLQIGATIEGEKIMVEGSTSASFEPDLISTGPLALRFNKQPALISIMPNDMAMAHKCAAWLERRLVRDLYDIYIFYDRLNARPNLDVLNMRLNKVNFLRGVKPRPKLKNESEYLCFLKGEVKEMLAADLEAQLEGLIDQRELSGIGAYMITVLLGMSF
jgi:predicted nucleotidyltransferase component of viral defense system